MFEWKTYRPVQRITSFEKDGAFDVIRKISNGAKIANHSLVDDILHACHYSQDALYDYKAYVEKLFPIWTGTLIAYPSPNKKLDKKLEFWSRSRFTNENVNYVIEVPNEYHKTKNLAIVMEDFKIEESNGISFFVGHVRPIEDFPTKDGWYNVDKVTRIPQGHMITDKWDYTSETNLNLRYLKRHNGKYMCLIARYPFEYCYAFRYERDVFVAELYDNTHTILRMDGIGTALRD